MWSLVELAANQGITFIATIFLARILSPTDFGIFAFAVLASAICTTFITGGLSALIVQRNDLTNRDLDRIFTAAILLSFAAAGLIAGLGPVLAWLYHYPILAKIMPVVAFQPLISSLGLIQSALLNKELHLAPIAKIVCITNVVSGTAAVAAALSGFGIWSLVLHMLLSGIIGSTLIWRFGGYRPKFCSDLKPLLPMLRFAGPVSAAQALHIVYVQGAALVLGKRYSAADIGLFNRGYGVATLPHHLFTGLVGKVALPVLAKLGDDTKAIRHSMKRGTESVMLISTPIFVGIALLSSELLELLYGGKWLGAAPVLTIIALSGILMPLQSMNVHLLLAKGMSRTFFRMEIAKKSVGITFVMIASFYGITAVAMAYLANSLIWLLLNTLYTRSIVGLGLLEQLTHIAGVLFTTGIMALSVWFFLGATELPLIARTMTAVLIGAITYFSVGFVGGFASFQRAFQDAKNLLARPR